VHTSGIPNFAVPELLFADDLSLLSNVHDQLQTILNRLRVYVAPQEVFDGEHTKV